MVSDKHTTITRFTHANTWVTTTNLHPYDGAHRDTCLILVTACKPTERQLRRHRKHALRNKRSWYNRKYVPYTIEETV